MIVQVVGTVLLCASWGPRLPRTRWWRWRRRWHGTASTPTTGGVRTRPNMCARAMTPCQAGTRARVGHAHGRHFGRRCGLRATHSPHYGPQHLSSCKPYQHTQHTSIARPYGRLTKPSRDLHGNLRAAMWCWRAAAPPTTSTAPTAVTVGLPVPTAPTALWPPAPPLQPHHRAHRQLACARISSPEGQSYLAAMACAANYAWVNRSSMTFLARQVRGRAGARAGAALCRTGIGTRRRSLE